MFSSVLRPVRPSPPLPCVLATAFLLHRGETRTKASLEQIYRLAIGAWYSALPS